MTSDQISILMIQISVGIIVITSVIMYVIPLEGRRLRRGRRQRVALAEMLTEAAGTTLELNWRTYGEVPKKDVVDLALEHQWVFVDDEIIANAWVLRFRKERQSDPR